MRDSIKDKLKEGLSDKAEAWRKIWELNHLPTKAIEELCSLVPEIIKALPHKNDGHQRELLKLLFRLNVLEESESNLWDSSFAIWVATRKQSSVRVVALKHLVALVLKYPALRVELNTVIEAAYLEGLSPGIRKSALNELRKLKEIK